MSLTRLFGLRIKINGRKWCWLEDSPHSVPFPLVFFQLTIFPTYTDLIFAPFHPACLTTSNHSKPCERSLQQVGTETMTKSSGPGKAVSVNVTKPSCRQRRRNPIWSEVEGKNSWISFSGCLPAFLFYSSTSCLARAACAILPPSPSPHVAHLTVCDSIGLRIKLLSKRLLIRNHITSVPDGVFDMLTSLEVLWVFALEVSHGNCGSCCFLKTANNKVEAYECYICVGRLEIGEDGPSEAAWLGAETFMHTKPSCSRSAPTTGCHYAYIRPYFREREQSDPLGGLSLLIFLLFPSW